jgi:hypothetical protein
MDDDKTPDFSDWLGLANQMPINEEFKFKSDDDLWKRDKQNI